MTVVLYALHLSIFCYRHKDADLIQILLIVLEGVPPVQSSSLCDRELNNKFTQAAKTSGKSLT